MSGTTDLDRPDPGLDARIRRELHQLVDGIHPTSTWDELRVQMVASSNHRRSRSSRVLALAAVSTLVVVLVVAAVARRGPSDVAIVPASPGAPASTLVGIAHGDLVELDPDGAELRVIAPGPFHGAPAVSPLDRTIYVERFVPGDPCSKAYLPADEVIGEIVAIPWSGGPPEVVVAHGTQPVLSPDGSRLAYLAAPTDTCVSPPEVRVAHVLDLGTRRVTPLGYVSVVLATVDRVGPTAWIADDSLVVAFTSRHRCLSGASRASCSSTHLQAYRFTSTEVDSEPVGTAPGSGGGLPADLTDAFQIPIVDAMAGGPDGSLVVATVDDARSLVLRRVTITGGGESRDLARYRPEQLGARSFATEGTPVTIGRDPGSDRIAVAVRDDDPGGAWHTATGPPADLGRLGTPAAWPVWVPAG